MTKLFAISLLSFFSGLPAFAADTLLSSAAVAAPPVSYTLGMEQRKRGDYEAARETFLKLLEQSPDSGGALEGLSLTYLSLGQYGEARKYLERWNAQSPHNIYVLGFLARAQNGQRDEEGALQTYKEIVDCDSLDCDARRKLDSSMERLAAGVFPFGKSYKSYSMEGLDTPNPQRIIYEGNSAGSRFRVPLKPGLDLIGGAEIRKEAQRNDGRNFTYYDILEQIYSAGLSGRPSRNLNWEAEYGQSVLSDLEVQGVDNKALSRVRLAGGWHAYDSDFKLTLTRAPKFVRGPGGTLQYFKLFREYAARAEAQSSRLGWDWLARGGIYDTSDGTTLGTYSLRGLREFGSNVFQSGYSHGQQEFYGAAADGRLAYVNTDRLSAGLRRTVTESYSLGASYAHTFYSDTNSLHDLNADLTAWLPGNKEFYGAYRFSLQDFRAPHGGYNSIDTRAHWLGAYWRRCHGRNWAALAGYERGFLNDASRGSYQGNNYLAEAEWYRGANASIRAQGRRSDTTVHDRSYSVGLQARYSFR